MPKIREHAWLTIVSLTLLPCLAEAQRFRDRPNPNVLRIQTYSSELGTISAYPSSGARCRSDVTVRFDAPRRAFFANDQRELQTVWSQWISYLRELCPEADTVQVSGVGETIRTYSGNASASDGWALRHEQTPLKAALEELGRARASFENLRSFEAVLQKHTEVFGGPGSLDAASLRSRIEERKAELANEQIARIETEAKRIPETLEGLNQIGALGFRVLEVLRRSYPQQVSRFDEIVKRREASIKDEVLLQFGNRLRAAPKGWKEGAATVRMARSIRESWGTRIPDVVPLVEQAIADVDRSVTGGLAAFKATLAGYAVDWAGLTSATEELRKVRSDISVLPALAPYADALYEWRGTVVASLEQRANSEIAAAGSTLDTLAVVIETGEALAKQFADIGERESAERLGETLSARLVTIAEANIESFERELAQVENSINAYRELLELERQYAEMARSMAVFGRYQAIAARRAGEVKAGLCGTAFTEFGRPDLLDSAMVTDRGRLPVRDVVCIASINGGKLTVDTGLWRRLTGFVSGSISLHLVDYSGNTSDFTLSQSSAPEHQRAYAGVWIKRGREEKALGLNEWLELVRIMMQGPPSGKADAEGRTECDLLASDPEDKAKRSPGRFWAAENDLALIERAIEACIAALEIDPDEPRLQYQLGRLLWSMGEQEQSKGFIDAATAKSYAPALALKAEMILAANNTYDGFVDAYLLLERSAKAGYLPASKQVKELNPQNLDIYKELPAPTSRDLLTALPGNQCFEVMTVRTCIRFTGANITSCMQMNRSDFSCEYTPVVSCENSANPLVDAMFRLACSQRQSAFGTFRKLAEGRWQKID